MLLGREEFNPNKPNNESRTPLSYAAWHGHEGMTKIPLEREVNPGKPGNCGHTPLVDAARRRKEVNPDKPDISGQSPLSLAAGDGPHGNGPALPFRAMPHGDCPWRSPFVDGANHEMRMQIHVMPPVPFS